MPVERAAQSALARGRRWFDASLLGRWWLQLLDLQFVDRAVALAAKAFVAFLPAVITFAAVAPERTRQNMVSTMEHRLGLSGKSLELVQSSLAGDPVDSSTSVVSMILLLFYATTFTSALQRLYLSAWRRPTSRDRVRELKGLVWLAVVLVLLALSNQLNRVFAGQVGGWFVAALGFCAIVALWWWTSLHHAAAAGPMASAASAGRRPGRRLQRLCRQRCRVGAAQHDRQRGAVRILRRFDDAGLLVRRWLLNHRGLGRARPGPRYRRRRDRAAGPWAQRRPSTPRRAG
jgi:hypothetical protein